MKPKTDKREDWTKAEVHIVEGKTFELVPADAPYPFRWRAYRKGKYYASGETLKDTLRNVESELTNQYLFWHEDLWAIIFVQIPITLLELTLFIVCASMVLTVMMFYVGGLNLLHR